MTAPIMKVCSSLIRGAIIAPPGKKLVVSDLSNIEGRGLAWLAGEEWKLQAFRDFDEGHGPDLYKLAYAKAFRVDAAEVTKFGRSVGKVMELGLGYAGGINAFVTFANVYGIDLDNMANTAWDTLPPGKVEEAEGFLDWLAGKGTTFPMSRRAAVTCEVFKRLWREAHPATVRLWHGLEDTFKEAIDSPGKTLRTGKFIVRRDGAWVRIVLPSGRALCYPFAHMAGDQIVFKGINQYTRQWSDVKTYSGKLAENCIAGETPVLTFPGAWKPISLVRKNDLVWDGHAWAAHDGLVYSGEQTVVQAFGVTMTPDHLVLTTEGWKSASSCEGHNRAACRLPHGVEVSRVEREELPMGSAMRLWEGGPVQPFRINEAEEARDTGVLRVPAPCVDREEEHDTRNESAPSLRGVEVDVRQVPAAHTPGLEKLRWAWGDGVRSVARILRELLGGPGANLSAGLFSGTAGQREGVFAGQLCLAHAPAAGEQHPQNDISGYAYGPSAFNRSGGTLRNGAVYPGVSARQRLACSGSPDDSGELRKSKVYDLKNCGPRSRFVVLGEDGVPVIVHNCTQSFARDILYDAMPRIEDAGYEIVLHVHDEVVTEVPDEDRYNEPGLSALLAVPPAYATDMPLAAAGYESHRYKKD